MVTVVGRAMRRIATAVFSKREMLEARCASGYAAPMLIRPYRDDDEDTVVTLWQDCELTRPWNNPRADIARKCAMQRAWFVVGEIDGRLVATAMAGYDGHRGWLNYLAVHPGLRRRGLALALVRHLEAALRDAGCPKLNLQVRAGNDAALAFYHSIGYADDAVLSLGKRLIVDAACGPLPAAVETSLPSHAT